MITDSVVQKTFVDGPDVLTWYDLHTTIAPPGGHRRACLTSRVIATLAGLAELPLLLYMLPLIDLYGMVAPTGLGRNPRCNSGPRQRLSQDRCQAP